MHGLRLARFLGWFSLALGALELARPRHLGRRLGLYGGGEQGLVWAYGLREVMTGVLILVSRQPAPWIAARIAGDAVDLATLARSRGSGRRGAALAAASVLGVTVLDILCLRALRHPKPARV